MDFGIFKIVSQFLLNFLNWLHGFLGSYGWSILALTAVVKIVLWPLQGKANKSMRRMSLLNPKVQELRDKYKDDPTRMNQEVMKLYKDYGINPVGGCLPMMIQIPIFFGLFKMLGQAVELRNSAFLWVKDLSQPDTVGAFVRRPDQCHPAVHGRDPNLVDGDDAEDRRPDPAPGDDVYATDLFVYLLQFCCGSGIVLHHTESFQYRAILLQQTTTDADS